MYVLNDTSNKGARMTPAQLMEEKLNQYVAECRQHGFTPEQCLEGLDDLVENEIPFLGLVATGYELSENQSRTLEKWDDKRLNDATIIALGGKPSDDDEFSDDEELSHDSNGTA